ncbi:hypothetical protein GCM10020367_14160 [Streptomyces sannanensis]|uniref:DUF5753 domain-containing protein n=1 Tax=Streptomyces sannanensis TaxID=285536 RepID=A0ABP6S7D4_9ACTN
MELEAEAVEILHYGSHTVSGLLQTEAYARARMRAADPQAPDETIDARVTARLSRQLRLSEANPPRMTVILDEAVLRRRVGGPAVMRAQLAALLKVLGVGRVLIQILPFELGEYGFSGGAQTLLVLADGTRIAYVEGDGVGTVLEEPGIVTARWHKYDRLRSLALPPRESEALIRSAMEDHARCSPQSST